MPEKKLYFLCSGQCVPYEDLYKFPDSHIIGHLRKVFDEGNRKITVLARWDVSISAAEVPPIMPEIDCEFIGDAKNIRCRHSSGCENKQRWGIGKSGILSLMHRLGLQDEYLKRESKAENTEEEQQKDSRPIEIHEKTVV